MGEVGCDTGELKPEFFHLPTRSYTCISPGVLSTIVWLCKCRTILEPVLYCSPRRMMYTDDLVSLWLYRWFMEAQNYTSSTFLCKTTYEELI